MYSCVIGMSKKVDKEFSELLKIIQNEYTLQNGLISLKGMIESVQMAASISQ